MRVYTRKTDFCCWFKTDSLHCKWGEDSGTGDVNILRWNYTNLVGVGVSSFHWRDFQRGPGTFLGSQERHLHFSWSLPGNRAFDTLLMNQMCSPFLTQVEQTKLTGLHFDSRSWLAWSANVNTVSNSVFLITNKYTSHNKQWGHILYIYTA